jgi:hypothetical protein
MAANKIRFMLGSPRAGRMEIPQPSADGDTKKKKLFLLAHETQRVGGSSIVSIYLKFYIFHLQICFVVNKRHVWAFAVPAASPFDAAQRGPPLNCISGELSSSLVR